MPDRVLSVYYRRVKFEPEPLRYVLDLHFRFECGEIDIGTLGSIDVAPRFYPVMSRVGRCVSCYPSLDHGAGRFQGCGRSGWTNAR